MARFSSGVEGNVEAAFMLGWVAPPDGTSQNARMAHAVIGGLTSSSALTLVVVPVLLTYVDGFLRA